MTDSRENLRGLFERLASGDLEALGPLYDELSPKIYGLALWRTGSSADAADVVQEVFLKLAAGGSSLTGVRHPEGYTFRIAHHACIDRLRARRREMPIDEFLVVPVSHEMEGAAAFLSGLIRQLPDEQRDAVYLRYYVGLSLREISTATGASLFTVASRCRLALRKLKSRLGEKK